MKPGPIFGDATNVEHFFSETEPIHTMASLPTSCTIVATPKTAGIWLVRDGNKKRSRQVDEADIFSMPDFEEKIAACEKRHKKQHYTFTTEPPPKDWSIAVADIVEVDIDGVGFVPALLPLT